VVALARRRLEPTNDRMSRGARIALALAMGVASAFVVAVAALLVAVIGSGDDAAVFRALRIGIAAVPIGAIFAWIAMGR